MGLSAWVRALYAGADGRPGAPRFAHEMRALILVVPGILGATAVLRGQESAGDIYVALIGHMDEQQQSGLREARRRFPQVPHHKMTFLLETGWLPSFQDDQAVENEVLRSVARRLADRNVRALVCEASCPLVPYRIAIREVNPREDVGRKKGEDLLLEVLWAASIRSGHVYEDRIVYRLAHATQGWEVVEETPIWHGDYRSFPDVDGP